MSIAARPTGNVFPFRLSSVSLLIMFSILFLHLVISLLSLLSFYSSLARISIEKRVYKVHYLLVSELHRVHNQAKMLMKSALSLLFLTVASDEQKVFGCPAGYLGIGIFTDALDASIMTVRLHVLENIDKIPLVLTLSHKRSSPTLLVLFSNLTTPGFSPAQIIFAVSNIFMEVWSTVL
jgi:hypothetical protein